MKPALDSQELVGEANTAFFRFLVSYGDKRPTSNVKDEVIGKSSLVTPPCMQKKPCTSDENQKKTEC